MLGTKVTALPASLCGSEPQARTLADRVAEGAYASNAVVPRGRSAVSAICAKMPPSTRVGLSCTSWC